MDKNALIGVSQFTERQNCDTPILYFKKKAKEAHDERDGIKDRTNMQKPDLAMTLTVMDGYYLGNTCLTLEMAYLNARVVARPKAAWLTELVKQENST